MRCPAPHASLICPCFGKPEVLGNVGNDGPGSEAARERSRASPTSSNGSLSHSEWFADEIARSFPFHIVRACPASDRLSSFQRQAYAIC